MKFKSTFLTVLLVSGLLAPSIALADGKGPGAKDLFFEQLHKPTVSINTGIQYWIECLRDNEEVPADNKSSFISGDKIKFHLTPNIDGYAYVLLRSGSSGDQAVLFPPDQDHPNENKVVRGKEIVLPANGTFTFDNHPGSEKLTLLISRTPIEAGTYLKKETANEVQPDLIAMASPDRKELVPSEVLIAYEGPPSGKLLAYDPGGLSKSPKKVATSDSAATTKVSKPVTSKKAQATPPKTQKKVARSVSGHRTVTIVSKKTGSVMAVDVALQHI